MKQSWQLWVNKWHKFTRSSTIDKIKHSKTKPSVYIIRDTVIDQHLLPQYCCFKLEIVDQWSTRIPLPPRRGWHCSKSQCSHFESDIADNHWASTYSHKGHAHEIWNWNSKANLSYAVETMPSRNRTRQIWGIWKLRPAYSLETPNLGQNRSYFVPYDLEISWMTLETNRAPLLCCLKLCATFHSHRWIQTVVAVRKRRIWVKFHDF